MSIAFHDIVTLWEKARPGVAQNKLCGRLLDGEWLEACKAAVQHSQFEEIERWLAPRGTRADIIDNIRDLHPFYAAQAKAYVLCCLAALDNDSDASERLLLAASRETDFPIVYYHDLKSLLIGQVLPAASHPPQIISVLLVKPDRTGVVCRLLLERIQYGSGALYPRPEVGFLLLDPDFKEAELQARAYARSLRTGWNDRSDVRWSLLDKPPAQRSLKGSSLGGSFAVGLQFLFSRPCDLSSYAVAAKITKGGELVSVHDWEAKFASAQSIERKIRAIITAPNQVEPSALNTRITLLSAPTVEEACRHIKRLRTKQNGRRRAFLLVLPAICLLMVLALINANNHVFQFEMKPGGRVVVKRGLSLPLMESSEIDTGFVRSDLLADRLDGLLGKRTLWHSGRYPDWPAEIADAMPNNCQKAILFQRIGREAAARKLFVSLLSSSYPGERMMSARRLSEADSSQSGAAVAAVRAMFDHPNDIKQPEYAELAGVIAQLDPRQGAPIIPVMHQLIQQTNDNYVRMPAVWALGKASRSEIPFILGIVKPLSTTDMNFQIRAMALREVIKYEPDSSLEPLKALMELIVSSNGDVRGTAFQCLREVGKNRPDDIVNSAPSIAAKADELVREGTQMSLENSVSLLTALALRDIVTARNEEEFKRAAESVKDFRFNDQRDEDVFSYIGAVKLTGFLKHQHKIPNVEVGVNHLLAEMKTPLGERWAIYRTACARAVVLFVPLADRQRVATRLRRLWERESRPELRIALAIAVEELR
jgi:hypothetical protein